MNISNCNIHSRVARNGEEDMWVLVRDFTPRGNMRDIQRVGERASVGIRGADYPRRVGGVGGKTRREMVYTHSIKVDVGGKGAAVVRMSVKDKNVMMEQYAIDRSEACALVLTLVGYYLEVYRDRATDGSAELEKAQGSKPRAKTAQVFWSDLFHDWEARWPMQGTPENKRALIKGVRTWFLNQKFPRRGDKFAAGIRTGSVILAKQHDLREEPLLENDQFMSYTERETEKRQSVQKARWISKFGSSDTELQLSCRALLRQVQRYGYKNKPGVPTLEDPRRWRRTRKQAVNHYYPPPRTSTVQRACTFLHSPSSAHQAASTIPDFYESFFQDWFTLWPEETDPDTGMDVRKRLRQWMNNALKPGKKSGRSGITTNVVLSKHGKAGKIGRKKRALSRVQCWQSLYYDDKTAADFSAYWKDFVAANPDKTDHRATVCATWCEDKLKTAPEDEIAAVEALWKSERESGQTKICPTQFRGQYSQDQLKTWDQGGPTEGDSQSDGFGWNAYDRRADAEFRWRHRNDNGSARIDQMSSVGLQVGESEETFKTWYKDHNALEMEYTRYLQHIFPASELPKRALANSYSSRQDPSSSKAPASPPRPLDTVRARAAEFAEWSIRAQKEAGTRKWNSMSKEARRAYVSQFRARTEDQAAAETLQPDNSLLADAVREAFAGDAGGGGEQEDDDDDEDEDEDYYEDEDEDEVGSDTDYEEVRSDDDVGSKDETYEDIDGGGNPSRPRRMGTKARSALVPDVRARSTTKAIGRGGVYVEVKRIRHRRNGVASKANGEKGMVRKGRSDVGEGEGVGADEGGGVGAGEGEGVGADEGEGVGAGEGEGVGAGEGEGKGVGAGEGEDGGVGGSGDVSDTGGMPQPKRPKPRPVPVRKPTKSGESVTLGGGESITMDETMARDNEDVLDTSRKNRKYRVCPICLARPYHIPKCCPIVSSGFDAIDFRIIELEDEGSLDRELIILLKTLRKEAMESERKRGSGSQNM
ncbi:uncharacterized protein STEHIDRAFT_116814, partial [Stereum hirsutum FP-91666 SS1]